MKSCRTQLLKPLQILNVSHFDIVIVGGGLVGACFARAIADSGLKTLVIDKAPVGSLYHPSMDNRGLALSYGTQQSLHTLKCWDKVAPVAHPIATVHVSEQSSFGFTKLTAASKKIPALGYVVSASNLGKAIVDGLEHLPDITIMRPANIAAAEFDSVRQQWNLTVNESKISAGLLIAADGANSELRSQQNIDAITTDFQQTAIVANVSMTNISNTTAYERFTPQGVVALLPFGAQQLKCVWTAPNSIAADLMSQTDSDFLKNLQHVFGFRLGKLSALSERKSFSIVESYATQLYSSRLVLIGNAANTLHPVAAQGFNLGMRDVMQLASLLRKSKEFDLKQYALLRQPDHLKTREFTNSLVNIFAKENGFIKFGRRLGIVAAQFVPSLNQKIISRGQGLWT